MTTVNFSRNRKESAPVADRPEATASGGDAARAPRHPKEPPARGDGTRAAGGGAATADRSAAGSDPAAEAGTTGAAEKEKSPDPLWQERDPDRPDAARTGSARTAAARPDAPASGANSPDPLWQERDPDRPDAARTADASRTDGAGSDAGRAGTRTDSGRTGAASHGATHGDTARTTTLRPGKAEAAARAEEMDRLSRRMERAVGGFVDDPRRAVKEADAVLDETAERLTRLLAERREALRESWGGRESGTEELRVALTHYRDMTRELLNVTQ